LGLAKNDELERIQIPREVENMQLLRDLTEKVDVELNVE